MSCLAGIDYGLRRIGVALSDDRRRVALPLTTVRAIGRADDDARAVIAALDGHVVDAFVVGLPLNADGSEGPQARLTRRFADALRAQSGRTVEYQDERLTSAAADARLASSSSADRRRMPGGRSARRGDGRKDRVAAQLLLQDYLDARNAAG